MYTDFYKIAINQAEKERDRRGFGQIFNNYLQVGRQVLGRRNQENLFLRGQVEQLTEQRENARQETDEQRRLKEVEERRKNRYKLQTAREVEKNKQLINQGLFQLRNTAKIIVETAPSERIEGQQLLERLNNIPITQGSLYLLPKKENITDVFKDIGVKQLIAGFPGGNKNIATEIYQIPGKLNLLIKEGNIQQGFGFYNEGNLIAVRENSLYTQEYIKLNKNTLFGNI